MSLKDYIFPLRGLKDMMKGFSPDREKVATLSHRQKKLLDKVLERIDPKAFDLIRNPAFASGQRFITDMMNPESEAYKKFEAPYMRQFQEQIVPGIAERFAGYDATESSGFNQAMASASTDLSERLASMKTNAMMGMVPQAGQFGTAQAGVYGGLFGQSMGTSPFGYQMNPGWGSGMMQGLGQALPMAAMALL